MHGRSPPPWLILIPTMIYTKVKIFSRIKADRIVQQNEMNQCMISNIESDLVWLSWYKLLFLESSLPYAYKFCVFCSRYGRSRGGGFSHACLMSPRDIGLGT